MINNDTKYFSKLLPFFEEMRFKGSKLELWNVIMVICQKFCTLIVVM